MPVCTADGWMIVLDGATSQWNLAVVSSAAIGPASGSPRAIRSMASRCGRMLAADAPGQSAARRASSSAVRAARKSSGR
jgi:hypothetical protein